MIHYPKFHNVLRFQLRALIVIVVFLVSFYLILILAIIFSNSLTKDITMPQATNIVLADALATPVNHTFVPLGLDANRIMQFADQSAASPIGYWTIQVQTSQPSAPQPGTSSKMRSVS